MMNGHNLFFSHVCFNHISKPKWVSHMELKNTVWRSIFQPIYISQVSSKYKSWLKSYSQMSVDECDANRSALKCLTMEEAAMQPHWVRRRRPQRKPPPHLEWIPASEWTAWSTRDKQSGEKKRSFICFNRNVFFLFVCHEASLKMWLKQKDCAFEHTSTRWRKRPILTWSC